MKNNINMMNKIVCFSVFLLAFFSCKHHENEYHSITDKIEAESKDYHGTSISSEAYIGEIQTIEITEGDHTFLIPERKSQIKSYACTECHSKPLSQMKSKDIQKAHWDIKMDHANENTMNCVTCHNPDNIDDLRSLTGHTIDFNTSYNLCNQCHTKQFEDWKGGAHGKRIGGWAPPRASMTCVNCHDPHKPHFESRWPARFNTQKVKERE
ncbi:cytochrome c3 family protein [Flavivirga abyssicola]|uniref:cytochrome c3 family protein n=1 Tax=Flavivirga abyssicola TaxID=3063533 RepID=UPI0026DFFF55|nr:cytochrome c3 family protein [Flavivirga sp. MEBiC07777]WVK13229.1 cytochrome c3 family protein [Flavivirga sp. MEBiC07777]